MALRNNTWKLNQWYDQDVAGNVEYSGEQRLMAWGANSFGALGQNNRTQYSSPVQIPGTNWSKTYSGKEGNSIGTKTDGTLWFWGYNDDGTAGTGQASLKYSSPAQIPGSIWFKPAIEDNFAMCSRTDGTLWTWGNNAQGTLGHNQPVSTKYSSPKQVPGTAWSQPFGSRNRFMGCTKTDGTLWMWGYGYFGYLGDNTNDTSSTKSSPVQIPGSTWSDNIATGDDCTIAIKTDGTLWAWGKNQVGQCAQNNNTVQYSSPVQIPGTTWNNVAGGVRALFATKTDGTLWSWGHNGHGQLGHNDRSSRSSPVQVPGTTWSHVEAGKTTYATKTDGTLWSWGENDEGNSAQNNAINYSSPVQIGTDTGWSLENHRNTTGPFALATFTL